MSKFAKKDPADGSAPAKAGKKKPPMIFGENDKGEPTFDDTKKGEKVSRVKSEKAPAKAASKGKDKAPAKGKAAPKKAAANTSEKEPDKRKIKLLTKENPKREGTASHERFALYKTSKTVQDFLDNGGTSADLRHDAGAGHIEVSE